MRILQTVAPAEFGGLEEVFFRLCSGLRDRGNYVAACAVFTGGERSHPFLERLSSAEVDVRPVFLPPRSYLTEITAVRELARSYAPDIVHTHGYRPDVLHGLATRARRVPRVTTLHGFTGGGWKNRLYEWLQIRSIRSFDAVIAVSHAMRPKLRDRGVSDERIHVIPNAWEPLERPKERSTAREALGLAANGFHVGWIGRMSHEKGPDVLLDAVLLLDEPDTVVTSFLGDGPSRAALEASARRSKRATVRFHGVIPRAARLLRAFDLFVLSSRTEGTPIVLFEAMAAGVPIIATRVGGVPAVVDSDSALLVRPEDPEALAEALRTVRRDAGAALERARQARESLLDRFSVEPWIQRHESLYRDVKADAP